MTTSPESPAGGTAKAAVPLGMLGTIACLSCPVAAEKPASFTVTENGAGHAPDVEAFSVGVREPLANELSKGFATKNCSVEAKKQETLPFAMEAA